MRSTLVTMAAVRSCMGVASSVVESKGRGKEAAKEKSDATTDHMSLYHALRLLLEAEHMIKGTLLVFLLRVLTCRVRSVTSACALERQCRARGGEGEWRRQGTGTAEAPRAQRCCQVLQGPACEARTRYALRCVSAVCSHAASAETITALNKWAVTIRRELHHPA